LEDAFVGGVRHAGDGARGFGPAVADSVEVECDADDGGVCEENVSVSSYEDEEDDLLEEEAVEDLFIEGVDGECSLFDPFCNLEWWPW
jgi:hypothetical protein